VLAAAVLGITGSLCPKCGASDGPRYVLVDGGAHVGETVADFEKSKLFSEHPWEVFSFECNPDLISRIPPRPYLTVLNKAIWVHDGEIDFYPEKKGDTGGSLIMFENVRVDQPVKVECVDFGNWLRENFREEDYILVKFDIEGAEYDVLERMLMDGSIRYVDELRVELHLREHKPGLRSPRQVIAAVRAAGVPVRSTPVTGEHGDWFED